MCRHKTAFGNELHVRQDWFMSTQWLNLIRSYMNIHIRICFSTYKLFFQLQALERLGNQTISRLSFINTECVFYNSVCLYSCMVLIQVDYLEIWRDDQVNFTFFRFWARISARSIGFSSVDSCGPNQIDDTVHETISIKRISSEARNIRRTEGSRFVEPGKPWGARRGKFSNWMLLGGDENTGRRIDSEAAFGWGWLSQGLEGRGFRRRGGEEGCSRRQEETRGGFRGGLGWFQ